MSFFIALAIAVLPAVLLLIYIFKKDAKPEPKGKIWKAILLGAATVIPIICVEQFVSAILFGEGGESQSFIGHCADAFFVAAIPEECFKLLALWLVLRKNPYFDEHYDGIVYAVCVGRTSVMWCWMTTGHQSASCVPSSLCLDIMPLPC